MPLFDRGRCGTVLEAPEKLLEVFGECNVRLTVERLDLQGIELGAKRRLFLSKIWHALA
ncbi:MAG: hypothetical protein KAR22_00365 [Gammaproteobacteria bacterium]|nr:hypothetical protein [Gammaproteobacteria bacterium]